MSQANTGGAPLGNQHAVKGKRWQQALVRALAKEGKGDADRGLDKIAAQVVKLALAQDIQAIKEIAERFDGKVPAGVEVTGANGGDLVVRDAGTAIGTARRVAYAMSFGALHLVKSGKADTPDAGKQAAKQGG